MGRVDQGHNGEPGEHHYEVFLSLNVGMNLFLCIYWKQTVAIRKHELEQVFRVLCLMVLPIMCYHTFTEQYFKRLDNSGNPSHINIGPCGNQYSHYLLQHLNFTGRFDKEALIDVLIWNIFWDGKVTLDVSKKDITQHALQIYGGYEKRVKSFKPKHIHTLALQLFADHFVELVIPDENKLGSSKLNKSGMYVRLRRHE